MVRRCVLKMMRVDWRELRHLRWKRWALLGIAALAWWSYAAPIHLAKRIRSAVEEPRKTWASSLISSRVDFAQVNAQLSGDLHGATGGHLSGESFTHLLLYGWLPQQRRSAVPGSVPVRAQYTRLFRIRYKELNRFIAIFWDPNQIHEVVLTLQRKSVLHPWHVTKVAQFNVCAYDFDCALIAIADLPSRFDIGPTNRVAPHDEPVARVGD